MSTPYIGEIRIFPYSRGAPEGWQACDGSLLSINEFEMLYQLFGTTYGGDGTATFGVPDLRGRVPVHQGTGTGLSPRPLGSIAGEETVTLTTQQMAPHAHTMLASTTPGIASSPANTVLAAVPATLNEGFYATSMNNPSPFPNTTLQPVGGGGGHDNTAPTLTLLYCIATMGIYPSQP